MDRGKAIAFINARCRWEDRGHETPCFVWQRFTTEKGYARTKVQGEQWRIHRLAYTLHVGPIPDGLVIDHLCCVRACCNPAHMEAVTDDENLRRAGILRGAAGFCGRGHNLAETRNASGNCKVCQQERYQRLAAAPGFRERRNAYMREWSARQDKPHRRLATKTHCTQGHELTPENIRLEAGRWRRCRTCDRIRWARARAA